MQRVLFITGGIVGSLVLAGCGLNGNLNATPTGNGTYHVSGTIQTSGEPSPSPSSSAHSRAPSPGARSTSPSASSSSARAHTGSPTGLTTIVNPPLSQIEEKINQGQIYGVADAQSAAPGQVVLLTAPSSLATPPTTLHHWPPHRFHVYAVLTDPENQLGATPWINTLHQRIHWLTLGSGVTIQVQEQSAASQTSQKSPANSESPLFNPVVLQAFRAISGHTTARIGGPTILPATRSGYLTAQTHASATSWRIQLVETSQPYAINSPLINGNHVVGGIAAWGVTMLSSTPPQAAQALEAANRLWTPQTVINSSAPHQSTQVGTAQYGRPATLYPVGGNQWSNTKLVFTEGEWTIELIGSNAASEEQAAYTIANTLHFQSLPSYPGLTIVDMVVPASSRAVSLAAAVTTLDWVQGSTVSWVSASQASSNNPEQAIQLATSWTLWNK